MSCEAPDHPARPTRTSHKTFFRIDFVDCSGRRALAPSLRSPPYYNSCTMRASETLAELGRDFHRRGWALGTSGNFSAVTQRAPLRVAITASSLDKGRLSADQILEVDADGKVVSAGPGKPSAETLLHVAIV